MVWIECFCCKKFRSDFVARTFALIAPVRPDLHRVSCCTEMVPNAPKHYEMHQKMSIWPSKMDRVPSLWKVPTQLRCTNFCINCISRPNLHRVSYCNKMVAKTPKHYKTHKSMSLGSNSMDRVPSLQKIATPLRCTNFYINCTSSARFAPSFIQ